MGVCAKLCTTSVLQAMGCNKKNKQQQLLELGIELEERRVRKVSLQTEAVHLGLEGA